MMVWCGSDLEEMMVVWRRSSSVCTVLSFLGLNDEDEAQNGPEIFPCCFLYLRFLIPSIKIV
jgi:hypothetical protein